jgi:hypothetical protein
MKNITLAVGENVLDRVRVVAAQRKTTVNALVRTYLEQLAGESDRLERAMRELREMSERTNIDLGPGHRFSREDAYADRVSGHERSALRSHRQEG